MLLSGVVVLTIWCVVVWCSLLTYCSLCSGVWCGEVSVVLTIYLLVWVWCVWVLTVYPLLTVYLLCSGVLRVSV